MPAVFNGIYGHKPTNGIICSIFVPYFIRSKRVAIKGLISNSGCYPPTVKNQDFMLTIGPLCRYSEDLSIVLDILLGKNKQKLLDFDKASKFNIFLK
jgi:Asp-tRNA(Asn)/Glu-tRNA(Gln) amidotransferase A subunit family amidase